VRRWCGKVIGISDDWNAVEQAHLRLALAEQKLGGADGARRAFQVREGAGHNKGFRLRYINQCPLRHVFILM